MTHNAHVTISAPDQASSYAVGEKRLEAGGHPGSPCTAHQQETKLQVSDEHRTGDDHHNGNGNGHNHGHHITERKSSQFPWFPWSRRGSRSGAIPDHGHHMNHKTVVKRETVPHEDHAQLAPAAIQVIASDTLNPAELYAKLRDAGRHKVLKPFSQTLIQAILAGFYVGFGSTIAMYMGGNTGISATQPWYVVTRLAYGASFTAGLMLIVLLGAELFTGNCIVCTLAWLEGDVAGWRYFLSLVFSWFGNLIGCLILVQLLDKSNLMHDAPLFKAFAKALGEKKVLHLTKEQVYVRGLLGNWLVCLAILMATASTSYTGKICGCFVPIFVFAALGFEHCIANQIMIPMGKLAGGDFTAAMSIKNNFIWSTLGNFTGGAVFAGVPYFLLYGRYSGILNKYTTF